MHVWIRRTVLKKMTQSREGNILVLRLKSSMIKEEIQSSQI